MIQQLHYVVYDQFSFVIDGWTTDDLIYQWKGKGPVQIAGSIRKSLPGGFELDGDSDQRCDVVTATGKHKKLTADIYIYIYIYITILSPLLAYLFLCFIRLLLFQVLTVVYVLNSYLLDNFPFLS